MKKRPKYICPRMEEITAERDKFIKAFLKAARDLDIARKEIARLKKDQRPELGKVNT